MLSRAQTCIISTGDVNYLVDQKSRFSLRIELNSPSTKSCKICLRRRSVSIPSNLQVVCGRTGLQANKPELSI
jgi:hypothetical protein